MCVCLFDIIFNFFAWLAYAISVKDNNEKTIVISLVFLIPFLYELGKNLYLTRKKIWGIAFGSLISPFVFKIILLSSELNIGFLLEPLYTPSKIGINLNFFTILYGVIIAIIIPLFRLSGEERR